MGGKAPASRLLHAPARAGLLVVLLCLPGTSVVGGDGGRPWRPWRKAALAVAGAGAGDGGPPSSTYSSCCRPPPLRTLKAKVADLQDAIHAKSLANKKTVTVQLAADKEMTVVLSTTKTKKQNNPAAFSHKTEFRKMAKAVKNQRGWVAAGSGMTVSSTRMMPGTKSKEIN